MQKETIAKYIAVAVILVALGVIVTHMETKKEKKTKSNYCGCGKY
jgi:uncharacterized membrane protein (DUF373 family)